MEEVRELKPRKHPGLYQLYQVYDEFSRLGVYHKNRMSSIEKKRSGYDATIEAEMISMAEQVKKNYIKAMHNTMKEEPIYQWLISIEGIGTALACQLISLIDDIGNFATISKLWRYAGYAVIDGQRETNKPGEKSHYSSKLKTACWQITDQFIKQKTPVYRDIYLDEKIRQAINNPKMAKGHIHNRAMRKTSKVFLQHVWVVWRELEGLPVSLPYVHDVMGHTHYIAPQSVEAEV